MYIGIDTDHRPAKQKGLMDADGLFFGCRGKLCAMATSGDGWGLMFALWILSGCVMAVKQPVDLCAQHRVCNWYYLCKLCTDVTGYYGNGKFNNQQPYSFSISGLRGKFKGRESEHAN